MIIFRQNVGAGAREQCIFVGATTTIVVPTGDQGGNFSLKSQNFGQNHSFSGSDKESFGHNNFCV